MQESGGVSSRITHVQCIILYSFSLYEFTSKVLIKVFNEVISTQDHMSYFLFSPPGFLRKFIRHIYCPFNSMSFPHIELKQDNKLYMLRHFLLIFPTGFEGVLATYQTLYSSYFFHRVFEELLFKMMMSTRIA